MTADLATGIPYDEIDPGIRALVRALNAFPGIETIGSCGGHDNPRGDQAGPGLWWVLLTIDRTPDSWLSLEFLAWAVTRALGSDGGVTLEADAAPPYLNDPGKLLRFVLQRHHVDRTDQEADLFAATLDKLRTERFIDAQLADELDEGDHYGYLAASQRDGTVIGTAVHDDGHHHEVVDVRLCGETVQVDKELADLVVEAYRAGITTTSSCQDAGESLEQLVRRQPHLASDGRHRRGRAYLTFAYRRDLTDFHEAVACGGTRDALYERMMHWAAPSAWKRSIGIDDFGLSDDDRPSTAPSIVPTSYQVEFPRDDIPQIIDRLRRFNAGDVVEHGDATWDTVANPDG
jgi:hypothetical protein